MEQDRSSHTPSGAGHHSTGSTPQNSASGSSATPGPSTGGPAGQVRSAAAGPASSSVNPHNSKRRRGLGIVTPNACTECRKKRAKVRRTAVGRFAVGTASLPALSFLSPNSAVIVSSIRSNMRRLCQFFSAMAINLAADASLKKALNASTKSPCANPKKTLGRRLINYDIGNARARTYSPL